MKVNCEDCNKEIDDNNILFGLHNLCDNCIGRRIFAKLDRIKRSGRCSECKKIMKDKTKEEKEFWEFYGMCFDCYNKD